MTAPVLNHDSSSPLPSPGRKLTAAQPIVNGPKMEGPVQKRADVARRSAAGKKAAASRKANVARRAQMLADMAPGSAFIGSAPVDGDIGTILARIRAHRPDLVSSSVAPEEEAGGGVPTLPPATLGVDL